MAVAASAEDLAHNLAVGLHVDQTGFDQAPAVVGARQLQQSMVSKCGTHRVVLKRMQLGQYQNVEVVFRTKHENDPERS